MTVEDVDVRPGVPLRYPTLDDWDRVRGDFPEHRVELVDGNLIIMAPPKTNHAKVVMMLAGWLMRHGYDARVLLADAGLETGQGNGRIPDLMVLHDEVDDMTYVHPPMVKLVVEVVSHSTARQDRYVKPAEYINAGIDRYWRVEGVGALSTARVFFYTNVHGEPQEDGTTSLTTLLESDPRLHLDDD